MLCQDNYFVVSVKLNFCWRQTNCIDDQDKVQPVTNTGNAFTDCQTASKKLKSTGILPASLHAFMENLKSDISEVYKLQVDFLKDS